MKSEMIENGHYRIHTRKGTYKVIREKRFAYEGLWWRVYEPDEDRVLASKRTFKDAKNFILYLVEVEGDAK